MNTSSQLHYFISMLVYHLPVLLVSSTALVLVIIRWQQLGPAAIWAAAGFGLTAALAVIMPFIQAALQAWIMQGNGPIISRAWAFSVLSIVWSLLHAVSFALLAVAIFTGCKQFSNKSSAPVPPP